MKRRQSATKSKRNSAKRVSSLPHSKKSAKKKSQNRSVSVAQPETKLSTPGTLTPKKREEFLECLRTHSNVTQAADEIQISKVSLYAAKKRDSEFSQLWDEAIKEGSQCLEDEAKRRAMGYKEDVYKNGVYVGKATKYSDLLLLALLNAHWPEKYRPARGDGVPALSSEDAKRIAEARDVLKRLDTDELATIATVMNEATKRAVAQAVAPVKRTLQ